jgi:hypothetical protein
MKKAYRGRDFNLLVIKEEGQVQKILKVYIMRIVK